MGFVIADIFVLIVFTPLVRLRPVTRVTLLSPLSHWIARLVIGVLRHVGRARIDLPTGTIPSRGGVIMVMNHQSLIDIPVAASLVASGCPRMVARARYGRGVPLVSHMITLYGHILVQPGKTARSDLDRLAATARASTLPILIYPEGHRTHDGEIGPWKRGGLDTFLSARDWSVYVVVIDGLLDVARLPDFVRNISRVRCRTAVVGPFEYDGRGRESHDEFIDHLRGAMCDKLASMRRAAHESAAQPAVLTHE